jgi:hypothetical protein
MREFGVGMLGLFSRSPAYTYARLLYFEDTRVALTLAGRSSRVAKGNGKRLQQSCPVTPLTPETKSSSSRHSLAPPDGHFALPRFL